MTVGLVGVMATFSRFAYLPVAMAVGLLSTAKLRVDVIPPFGQQRKQEPKSPRL